MTTLDERVRVGMPRLRRREMEIVVVEGTVGALKIEEEGATRVLRFLVQPDEGAPVPIEMRGEKLHGVLIEGHRVDIRLARRLHERGDATLHPRELRNLTTNGVVRMWRPGWLRSAVRMMSPGEFRSAGISAVVGAGIALGTSAVLRLMESSGAGNDPAPRGGSHGGEPSGSHFEAPSDRTILLGLLAVAACLGAVELSRLLGRRHSSAALLGLFVGLAGAGVPLLLFH